MIAWYWALVAAAVGFGTGILLACAAAYLELRESAYQIGYARGARDNQKQVAAKRPK